MKRPRLAQFEKEFANLSHSMVCLIEEMIEMSESDKTQKICLGKDKRMSFESNYSKRSNWTQINPTIS